MLPDVCLEHNKTTRVDVTFHWRMYDELFRKEVTVDLVCRCRVYEQLRAKFLEVAEIVPYSPSEIVFSCISYNEPMIANSGKDIYNGIKPAFDFYHCQNAQLDLNVKLVEVPAATKLASLERSIKECNTAIKSDKNWRVLKDTEIAEEQLSIREMFEKQQKEIKALQKEMSDLKRHNERREREEERRFSHLEVHDASCDQCDDLIIGHRFKCSICINYDLCQKCESQGAHPHHAMIRIVSAETTEVPSHLIPENKLKMASKEVQFKYSGTCDCQLDVRANAKKVSIISQKEQSIQTFRSVSGKPEIKHQSSSEKVPEITIEPPIGQTTPFNQSDYSMKLIDSVTKETTKEKKEAETFEEYVRKIIEKSQLKAERKKMNEFEKPSEPGNTLVEKRSTTCPAAESDSDDIESICSCSSCSSDSSDSSDSSSIGSIASSMSFETLAEILRDIQLCENSTEKTEKEEDFHFVEDEEDELHTAVAPTPETTD